MPTEQFPSRRTPAKGVHIFLGGPNWVFLTVNAKERVLFRSKTDAQQRVPTNRSETDAREEQAINAKETDARQRVPTSRGLYTVSDEKQRVPTSKGSKPIIKGSAWLAQDSIQKALHEIWLNTATAWLVSDYLLMPDHLHLFCAPRDLHFTIERWIAFWKDCLAKTQPEAGAFQRGGFHHRLRGRESYSQKWQYVRENPVRAGLVEKSEDWPYHGRVYDIRWD